MQRRIHLASTTLRIGLAAVFLYAAISAIVTPSDWIGYLPQIIGKLTPTGLALALFSGFQLVMALWLLVGVYVRYAAIASAVIMAAIVVSDIHLFAITFRDIAIGCGAVALAFLGE